MSDGLGDLHRRRERATRRPPPPPPRHPRVPEAMESRLRSLSDAAGAPVPDGNTLVVLLDVGLIEPDPDQPRRFPAPFSVEEPGPGVAEFAAGVEAAGGILHPIVVRPHGDGYRLVVGERRWRAYRLLASRGPGWDRIPAIRWSGEVTPVVLLALQIIENDHREDLDSASRREGYLRLQAVCGGNASAAMRAAGVSRTTWYRVVGQPDPEGPGPPSKSASGSRLSFGQITKALASVGERIDRLSPDQVHELESLLDDLLERLRQRPT